MISWDFHGDFMEFHGDLGFWQTHIAIENGPSGL